ncbi:unnamed protein product [Agarophyton chilense]
MHAVALAQLLTKPTLLDGCVATPARNTMPTNQRRGTKGSASDTKKGSALQAESAASLQDIALATFVVLKHLVVRLLTLPLVNPFYSNAAHSLSLPPSLRLLLRLHFPPSSLAIRCPTMVFGRKKAQPSQPLPPPPPPSTQTPAQTARAMARQNDRTVQRAQRDMQRERLQLEQKERQLEVEIKKLGRQGRIAEARILAKNLVQVRNAKARTFQAGAHAGAIATQAKMAATEAKMMEVIGNTTQVMQNANGMNDSNRYMNMLQQYDMQSEKYKLKQEMTDEVLDSVLGGEDIGAESDDVLNSVLDEIGLEVSSKMGGAAVIAPQSVPQQPALQQPDAALMARIERLGN